VAKRRNTTTFNDIVKDVQRISNERVVPVRERGLYPDDFGELELVDESGHVYRQASPHLASSEAQDLALAGAGVVWDPCGCGGGCGMTWLSREDVKAAVASGPPKIVYKPPRHIGAVSKWVSDNGHVYLLAEEQVLWGDRLA
jgi:hypothetical protein